MNSITSLFKIKYPIIQGGMIWNSGYKLASAVSNAGGLGLIGAGSMYPEVLREHIRKCHLATSQPFGVNIPMLYPNVEEILKIIVEEGVKIVFTSAGNPKTWTPYLKENGIRKALNFGHTLGHAIESYFLESEDKKQLLHGEAIAVGMILESHISYQSNLISKGDFAEIKYIITDIFEKIIFNESDIQNIMNLLIFDKKNEFGNVQFTLLNKIGESKINQIVDESLILLAFEDYFKN